VENRRPQSSHAGDGSLRQAFALIVGLLGLWIFATGSTLGLFTMLLAYFLYTAAGQPSFREHWPADQAHNGRRHHGSRAGDHPRGSTLLDAQEQFFMRYRWPWFRSSTPRGTSSVLFASSAWRTR